MPTIKTMTFKQGGHHATCAARRRYLEADDRHIGRICVNIADPERWDAEMDRARAQYRLRGNVTYREFIISPDAAGHATQGQVRELALRWLGENFPSAEAAIVLHDDNRERVANGKTGIAHAHVVVNSVDLETGRKVVIKDAKVRELHNSLQRIGSELGLSTVPDYEPGKRLQSQQAQRPTCAERQMTLRGVRCWKAAVRDMALQALDLSTTPAEFSGCLDKADVDVTVEHDRVYLTDRDNPTRSVRADKLDSRLSGEEIMRRYGENMVTLNNLEELHEFARTLGGELQQGSEMRAQMQRYDRACRDALKSYQALTRRCDGMRSDGFPAFSMPKPQTEAQRIRYEQVASSFNASADEAMR